MSAIKTKIVKEISYKAQIILNDHVTIAFEVGAKKVPLKELIDMTMSYVAALVYYPEDKRLYFYKYHSDTGNLRAIDWMPIDLGASPFHHEGAKKNELLVNLLSGKIK